MPRAAAGSTVLAVSPAALSLPPHYLIGIDGGGSGTRARLQDRQGRLLGQGQAGPSGLSNAGALAWDHVLEAIAQAFGQAGLPTAPPGDCAIGIGLAGAGSATRAEAFRRQAPAFAALALDSDAAAALLGAFAGRPGLLIAAGTGSVAMLQTPEGSRRLAGGWGFGVGDEGSGAWLGQQAVRLAQQALDGRAAAGALAHAVWQVTGSDRTSLLNWVRLAGQAEHAALAPSVFALAGDDPAAARLLDQAAGELAALAQALDPAAALPVVISGSLGRRLQALMPAELQARCVAPVGDAAQGALLLLSEATAALRP